MTHYYKLANPGISAISIDGRSHAVNDGVLEVEDEHVTPNFKHEITGHFGGQLHNPDEAQLAAEADDEAQRQILFAKLDVLLARKVDRRRSLGQLREMLADYEARQPKPPAADDEPAA